LAQAFGGAMRSYEALPPVTFAAPTLAAFLDELRELRAAGSVANVKGAPPLVVRQAAVAGLMSDKRLRGMGMDYARTAGIPEGSRAWRWIERQLLHMNGADHYRLRRLVARAFTANAIEALRPYARSVIRGLIDAVFDAGRCDAVEKLTNPLPIPVICALLGVATDRAADMSRWTRAIGMVERRDAGARLAEIEQALKELDDYLDAQIALRRAAPRDDLLSRLIAVEESGDRLSSDQLKATLSGLLSAGTDTTRNQLASMIQSFIEHPDQWSLLRSRRDLVPNAVEEAIRWQPAVGAIALVPLEDIEIDGVVIPEGTVLLLSTWSANHDESALPGAARFDITREASSTWRVSSFGGGVHYCIGASLARLELTEALDELASRFDDLRADGKAVLNPAGSSFWGYRRLPIAWTT